MLYKNKCFTDISDPEGDKRERDTREGETCTQHNHRHVPGTERLHVLGNWIMLKLLTFNRCQYGS